MNILISILAILPGLLICYGIYRYDKYNKEPALHLAACFVLGLLITYPAILVEQYADQQGWEDSGIGGLLLVAFIFVALNEELVKYLVVVLYPFPRSFFDEPLDGIVYALMVSMGFATLENVIYANQFGLETTLIRSFTAVPAHASFAVIGGYFIGKAKFDQANKYKWLLLGLGAAVLPHGLYDFFILQDLADWLTGLVIPVLIICVIISIRLIRKAQKASPFITNTSNVSVENPDSETLENNNPLDTPTSYDEFFKDDDKS